MTSKYPQISFEEISTLAGQLGLTLVAVLPLESASERLANERDHLARWQEAGFAAEMSYMERSPALFTNIEHFLPQTRSILCFYVNYFQGGPAASPEPGYGRIARYAWGRDYHRVLKKKLTALMGEIETKLNSTCLSWRSFTDAVPLLERALGAEAGLGFVGKNTMLIRPRTGSFGFLAEVLCNIEVEGTVPDEEKQTSGSCGSCVRCIAACPTDAFISAKKLDAGRCISYLTIEKKTVFSSWEQRAIGDWIFGCDACQDPCPFNHPSIAETKLSEFSAESGSGPFLALQDVLGIRTSEQFLGRFAGTALMRAGRESLLRNASCIVANSNFYPGIDALIEARAEDESELVRSHAGIALNRLYKDSTGVDRRKIESVFSD